MLPLVYVRHEISHGRIGGSAQRREASRVSPSYFDVKAVLNGLVGRCNRHGFNKIERAIPTPGSRRQFVKKDFGKKVLR